jgi:lycopene cyclase CruA
VNATFGVDRERSRGRLLERCAPEVVQRLEALDRGWASKPAPEAPPALPDRSATFDVDVAVLGGGLWSLMAPLLAQRGLRVTVFERFRVGASHREWNASRAELTALAATGLVTEAEIDELIVARYREGVCAFAGGGRYAVRGVLDCAVDADALLARARRAGEAAGVSYRDGCEVLSHAASTGAAAVRVREGGGVRDVSARLLVDARGATSPLGEADLVCPTVGAVLKGLDVGDAPDQVDPAVGEILVTVDGVDGGRQHVWEAFPGRPGEVTVYLFYYAPREERASLVELFDRFLSHLSTFKRGEPELVRPTFGFIPGRSRLSRPTPRKSPHVLSVGDAASRHSPLTACGFGAMLRDLAPMVDAVERRVHGVAPSPMGEPPIHSVTGALAAVMSSRALRGDELNRLLDAAFGTLAEMGEEAYAALLRDEMKSRAFATFLRRTAARHPETWRVAARSLGVASLARWARNLAEGVLASDG